MNAILMLGHHEAPAVYANFTIDAKLIAMLETPKAKEDFIVEQISTYARTLYRKLTTESPPQEEKDAT